MAAMTASSFFAADSLDPVLATELAGKSSVLEMEWVAPTSGRVKGPAGQGTLREVGRPAVAAAWLGRLPKMTGPASESHQKPPRGWKKKKPQEQREVGWLFQWRFP